jgi:hypothetical protein
MMRRLRYNKFGLAENPIDQQVRMVYCGRVLLGDVRDFSRDEVTGSIRLRVNHFNGEPWPIEPVANLVEVFE